MLSNSDGRSYNLPLHVSRYAPATRSRSQASRSACRCQQHSRASATTGWQSAQSSWVCRRSQSRQMRHAWHSAPCGADAMRSAQSQSSGDDTSVHCTQQGLRHVRHAVFQTLVFDRRCGIKVAYSSVPTVARTHDLSKQAQIHDPLHGIQSMEFKLPGRKPGLTDLCCWAGLPLRGVSL